MKKYKLVTIFLILLFLIGPYTAQNNAEAQERSNLKLVLKLPLKSVGADGGEYPVFVEIQNVDGEPVQMNRDIEIKLFSSDIRVASVPDRIIFPRGAFYTIFNLKTTNNPGTTEITALAPGFESGKLFVKTQLTVGYPKKLAVYVYPQSLIPSPSESAYVVVQLQDSMGKPSRAPSNIYVNLFLSNPLVGSLLDDRIVVEKGSTYGFTRFQPTTIPGSTVITATAPGLESGSSKVTSIGPTPEKLIVEAAPDTLPSNGRDSSYIYVTAYLVDRNGFPAWASSEIKVIFTSSNTTLAYFKNTSLTIQPGEFFVRNKLYSAGFGVNGTVEISVQAEGLESSTTTVNVISPSNETGGFLRIFISPPVYPPGELTYRDSIVVQVVDSDGIPIITTDPIKVYLSSSNPIFGTTAEASITIPVGSSIATTDFKASKLVGSTTITASANDFISAESEAEVKAPPPVRLKLGIGPENIRATGDTYPFLFVQLQDELGRPTTAQDDIVVELSSSNSQFGEVPNRVTIPRGTSFAIINFTSTSSQGITNITASSTGFESDYITVETIEPFPSILSAVAYTQFVANGGTYPIYIQLLDISGRPAKPELTVNISLVSSNPEIITVPSEVQLEEGMSYTLVEVTTSLTPGDVTVSIAASGYTATSINLRSILLPLSIEVEAATNYILSNETLEFTVLASHKGVPVEQVQITVDANNGDITGGGYTGNDGSFTATYLPSLPGDDVIRVSAFKPGYESISTELDIYVDKYIDIQVRAETIDGLPIANVPIKLVDSLGNVYNGVSGSDGWVTFENIKWGSIMVSVETNVTVSDTRYLFNKWGDGTENSTWTGNLIDDFKIKALYNVQYFVRVISEYGTPYGSGWYPKGTSISIGIDETSVPINPLIYKKFKSWSGDIFSTEASASILVDSPKYITAVWEDDYLYLYIFLAVVAAAGGSGGVIYYLYRKGKILQRFRAPPEEEEEVGLEEYFMAGEELEEKEEKEVETVEEEGEVKEEAPEEAEEAEKEAPPSEQPETSSEEEPTEEKSE